MAVSVTEPRAVNELGGPGPVIPGKGLPGLIKNTHFQPDVSHSNIYLPVLQMFQYKK